MSAVPPLVLHVIHHLQMGGLENGLVNLINHMPPSRYRHAIVCVEDYSDFRQRIRRPEVEVYALHRSRIGVWQMRKELYQLFRRLRPAIVHSRNMSGLDALLPARLAGVPCRVHGEHGWDVGDLKGERWKPTLLRRLHAPLVSGYVTVSRDLETYLAERVGIGRGRISQVYNGVDTDRFVPRPGRDLSALPDGFADEGCFIAGTVGRLQAVKDQATLVRAFAAVLKTAPDVAAGMRLVIVGDGALAQPLRALVEELGIGSQVWFAGASNDVPRIMAGFDVFVLPSLSEGISNTILEAMACGLPVLATAAGGNVELVQEDYSGRLFQPGDTRALGGLLTDYARTPALCRQHGEQARQAAVERFSLSAMVNNYMAVYEKLAAPR
ncbi:TIGR03088 family PEP-CTERM/XrtA system glycosyltransferase [Duganella callida]|uniref:TIGR03088 family PEP-CTERM/XrtA system glycosyltransferase n=1 Tax=Duganella callida TaxID=2561932 RepID=A0A4Y9SBT0_9BURK|nr:TIGR03088 family PEP-CTERM/XrtA system glycosyltransferase [Duganella callida]TFW19389.1 TIGR03088 family PEP-CTERM/XrtA system glycosyltransferase [Duganella callida]